MKTPRVFVERVERITRGIPPSRQLKAGVRGELHNSIEEDDPPFLDRFLCCRHVVGKPQAPLYDRPVAVQAGRPCGEHVRLMSSASPISARDSPDDLGDGLTARRRAA